MTPAARDPVAARDATTRAQDSDELGFVQASVKNTFLEFDSSCESPAVIHRTCSAPVLYRAPNMMLSPARRPGTPSRVALAQCMAESTTRELAPTLGMDEPAARAQLRDVGGELRTTIMLRSIPCWLSTSLLKELLDEQGFRAKYDLMYMPMDFARDQNLGYAFVNMVDPAMALRSFDVFRGFTKWKSNCGSDKGCEVTWSRVQGLQQNVEQFRNCPAMDTKAPQAYRPLMFVSGEPVEFPKPTRRIWQLSRTPKHFQASREATRR